MFARVYAGSTPEQRIATCLSLMSEAAADKNVPIWLAFRHLFDLAVMEAGR
jgi:hypothetical protein